MVTKVYFLHASKYKSQLRPILQSQWEAVKIPGSANPSPYAEAYRNGKQKLAYDGNNNVCIETSRTRELNSLEAKLRKMGINLIERKEPKENG